MMATRALAPRLRNNGTEFLVSSYDGVNAFLCCESENIEQRLAERILNHMETAEAGSDDEIAGQVYNDDAFLFKQRARRAVTKIDAHDRSFHVDE